MYNIVICEDNKEQIKIILNYLRIIFENIDDNYNYNINIFNSAEEMLEKNIDDVDIFLLDIKMKKMSGMEAAQNIRSRGINSEIIFLTGLIEYAKDGYKVRAYRYILKPIKFDELQESILNCIEEINKNKRKYFLIDQNGKIEKIKIDLIKYIEINRKELIIHLVDKNIIYSWKSIAEFDKKLEKYGFFRVHKSFLVNMIYIDLITNDAVIIGVDKVPVSKYRIKDLKQKFTRFIGRKI